MITPQQFYFLIWTFPSLRGGLRRRKAAYRKLLPLLWSRDEDVPGVGDSGRPRGHGLLRRYAPRMTAGRLGVGVRGRSPCRGGWRKTPRSGGWRQGGDFPPLTRLPAYGAGWPSFTLSRSQGGRTTATRLSPEFAARYALFPQTPSVTRLLSRSAAAKDNDSATGVCLVQAGLPACLLDSRHPLLYNNYKDSRK